MITVHLFEVETFIDSDWNAPLFSGRLVKSFIVDANPNYKPLFAKTSGPEPKLIHVSPLFRVENGRIRCIYSQVKCNPKDICTKPNPVQVKGRYTFYVGFVENGSKDLSFDTVFNTIMNMTGKHVFSKHIFNVEILSVRTVDVDAHAKSLVQHLTAKIGNEGNAKIRVIFASPTMLRDPFKLSNYKEHAPIPLFVFSTPVYIYMYLSKTLKSMTFKEAVIMIHRLFDVPHTASDTTKKVRVFYNSKKRRIPALIGYVNLYLNYRYYEHYSKRYYIEDFLEEIFKIMTALGTGTSRASGFGHVIIELKDF